MSFKCRDGTQRWRTSEESGLIAVRDVGFIITADIGDIARNGKVVRGEVPVAAIVR